MVYFLAWLFILPAIYVTVKAMEWAMDLSDGAMGAAIGLPVLICSVVICLMIVVWPFYMNSDEHRQVITLDGTVWGCAKTETVIEPVHHLVGKIIVTRNEPVTECLQYSRAN